MPAAPPLERGRSRAGQGHLWAFIMAGSERLGWWLAPAVPDHGAPGRGKFGVPNATIGRGQRWRNKHGLFWGPPSLSGSARVCWSAFVRV